MTEIHIIGHILEASGFEEPSLFAKWLIQTNFNWKVLEGYSEGQTQLSNKVVNEYQESQPQHIWSHPIDVHYATKGLQGWPKLEFHVWGVDWLGRTNISAYGFLNVPMHPGYHKLECYTWRPIGNLKERIIEYLWGYRMHLVDPSDPITNGLRRHAIRAQSMGVITLELNIVLKEFKKYGFDI